MVRTVVALILSLAMAAPSHGADPQDDDVASPIDMPAPPAEPGNTYARGMAAVLSHLGTDVSYDRVMGLTGVAFILQLDTSGPFVDGDLDCAWWPNDAWGFDLGLPVLSQAVGWQIRKVRRQTGDEKVDLGAEYRRTFAPVIEASLAAGKPVLAEHDHCFIVTAVDGGEPPVLGYGTRGKSTRFGDVFRISCYPWGLIAFGEPTASGDPADVDLASLHHIIALHEERARGPDAPATRFSGRQAWSEWLRLLGNGQGCDNNMLIHLRYNRGSAVAYLRDMAARYSDAAAAHLAAAADLYQQSLDDLMAQPLPYPALVEGGEKARATRASYAAMVAQVAAREARAVAALQAAVTSLSGRP